MYKIFEIHKWDNLTKEITLKLKNTTILDYDSKWKEICEVNRWPFYDTYGII